MAGADHEFAVESSPDDARADVRPTNGRSRVSWHASLAALLRLTVLIATACVTGRGGVRPTTVASPAVSSCTALSGDALGACRDSAALQLPLGDGAYDGDPRAKRAVIIDVSNGGFAVQGARRYAPNERVPVVVRNINPFAGGRVTLREAARGIASTDNAVLEKLFSMLPLVPTGSTGTGAAGTDTTKKSTPAGGQTPGAAGAPAQSATPSARQTFDLALSDVGRQSSSARITNMRASACTQGPALLSRYDTIIARGSRLTDEAAAMSTWAVRVPVVAQSAGVLTEPRLGGLGLARLTQRFARDASALDTGQARLPAADSLRRGAHVLSDDASALERDAVAARDATAACQPLVPKADSANVAAKLVVAAAESAAVQRARVDSTFNAVRSLGRAADALLRTPAAWAIRHEIGGYDTATVVTLSVDQTTRTAGSETTGLLGSTDIRFGRANFLALGVGVAYAKLPNQAFAIVTGPDTVRRIGQTRNDASRTPVMALVHARVLDVDAGQVWLPRLTLHLTGGGAFTSATANQSDRDWLLGVSLGAAAERVFLTAGYLSGVVTDLDPLYQPTKDGPVRVPSTVNDVPTTTRRSGRPVIALSFRLL